MTAKPLLNIIGCGRLGKTLARLWSDNRLLTIGGICNRSANSAAEAQTFIGGGTVYPNLNQLPATPLWLIAVPDSEIATIVQQLDSANIVPVHACVFHCSGAQPATIMQPLKDQGAHIASIHPVHSFANPQRSLHSFTGTYCAMDGDQQALAQLGPLFAAIGGRTFQLSAASKPLYHAATAVASNYLVALLETALSMLEKTGLSRDAAQALIRPIVLQTAENVCTKGTMAALTGPIARGDVGTIKSHIRALLELHPEALPIYKQLGNLTLPLAKEQGTASTEQLQKITELLLKP